MKTSRFSFPRRVRIHGGECGAVARALHHAAQKEALMPYEQVKNSLISDECVLLSQADLGKASGSTFNERKQMSTKTTLKRIALVAVSALGFGLVSSVTAIADGYTSGTTLSSPSGYTVVGTAGNDTNSVYFYVDTTNLTGTTSTAAPLEANETLTVSVVGVPGAKTTAPSSSNLADDIDVSYTVESGITAGGSSTNFTIAQGSTNSVSVTSANTASGNGSYGTSAATNNEANRYWFVLSPTTASAIDAGAYTIRVRLQNANNAVVDKTFSVKWVSSIADAGATLTLAATGNLLNGEAFNYTANRSITATLKDANGGRVVLGMDHEGDDLTVITPELNANVMTGSTGSTVGQPLNISDAGTTGQDYVQAAADTAETGTDVTTYESAIIANRANGVYGVYTGAPNATTITESASTTSKVRVRVTGTSVSSTVAMIIGAANAAVASSATVTAKATGLLASDTSAKTGAATTYNIPLTTSAVNLTIDDGTDVAGKAYTATVTWGGNYASANVTPASETAVVYYTDSLGRFALDVTNTNAVNGSSATIDIIGFASSSPKMTVTLEWEKATATTLTIVDPVDGVYALLKSATKFTVKLTDQFGNAMKDEQIKVTIPSSLSSNYSATTTYAPITTDANGVATWTLTDAKAIADGTDGVTFESLSNSAATDSYSITYKSALPAVANMYGYYADTFQASPTSSNVTVAVPSTGIVASATAGLALQIDRNLSKDLSAAATDAAGDDLVQLRIRNLTSAGVAATGAAVTLTAGEGGHVLDVAGLPATSRTTAVDGSGDVYFKVLATKPGTINFTVTSGSASATYKLVVADPDKELARTVAISGASAGTANAEGVPMTVTVTDRYGNGVKNVSLTITATGVGAFMGGATSQSFTTDNTGKFTFLATSYAAAGGTATFTATASNAGDAESIAGYTGSTAVDSTLAAGKKSASATVTFAAGQNASQTAAEAASDAAAEAIDAANAATDAANLAAEAADAATVAAEEARDAADAATAAVEELSTQVATLMAALRAQITTLANTVAKIAKKVRA